MFRHPALYTKKALHQWTHEIGHAWPGDFEVNVVAERSLYAKWLNP
jgi:hypothetical protein